jgi:hypothetical protein
MLPLSVTGFPLFSFRLTLAITGGQKQSEAALLHVRVDGLVRPLIGMG